LIHDAVAIIPARGGSVRIPRKNIRMFHGKPIIAYSIETARLAGITRIVVSTDDFQIAGCAEFYGCEVHKRDYDDGTKGTQEVTADVLRWLGNGCPTYACCIYPTAPLMLPEDLVQGGFEMLGMAHYVYPVGTDLVDAGQWYWGHSGSFIDGVPLEGNALRSFLPDERVCDINFPEDWLRAEGLYAKMKGI
jgi:pseudaminic acid cytidylyltransferase